MAKHYKLNNIGFSPTSLVDLVNNLTKRDPEKLIFTFLGDGERVDGKLRYKDLDSFARRIAAQLQKMKLTGERALLLFNPGFDYISAFMGCLYAGVIAVPAYPPKNNRNLPRLKVIVNDSTAKIALTSSSLLPKIENMFSQLPGLDELALLATDTIDEHVTDSWVDPQVGLRDLAFLQYTSGSTGDPKGVMLTHGNLLHNISQINRAFQVQKNDVGVIWLPPYHDMGLIGGLLVPIYSSFECILMPPAAFLQRPARMLEAISRYKGTICGGPNFSFDFCVDRIPKEQYENLDLSSLRLMFNGAEPVRNETLERFKSTFQSIGFGENVFLPCYGLAESSVYVAASHPEKPVACLHYDRKALEKNILCEPQSNEFKSSFVSSGDDFGDQDVKIVDSVTCVELPEGEIGEIWVSGDSVAQGYWNKEKESQKTFCGKLDGDETRSFMRTEDLGFMKKGHLFVTGRIKDLIIIRGVNYYPQDIERAVESSHSSLRQGGGAAFSVDVNGEEKLVIVHEIEFREKPDITNVAETLKQIVADEFELQLYALVLVKPGRIPKTSSGKIQRNACRIGFINETLESVGVWNLKDETGAGPSAEKEPNASSENKLGRDLSCAEWLVERVSNELKIKKTDIELDKSFVSYGLDSIHAIQISGELEQKFKLRLTPDLLYEYDTIKSLSDFIIAQQPVGSKKESENVKKHGGRYQLSYGQKALYIQDQFSPESVLNPVFMLSLKAELETTIFKQVFQDIVDRHEQLRTTFELVEGEPVQVVHSNMPVAFIESDWSDYSGDKVQQLINKWALEDFDLENGPLFKIGLFKKNQNEYFFGIAAHHIITDMWSLAVIINEFGQLYFEGKTIADLAPVSFSYYDFVSRQAKMLQSADGEKLWAYWSGKLAGELPVLELPTDFPRPKSPVFTGASERIKFDSKVTDALKNICRQNRITMNTLLLAVFNILLARHSGQDDIIVGSPFAGRGNRDFWDTVGYYVNVLPLRNTVNEDEKFSEFLSSVNATVNRALAHQDYPFYELVERLQPERDASHTPIYKVMYVYQRAHLMHQQGLSSLAIGSSEDKLIVGDAEISNVQLDQERAIFDLSLLLAESNDGLNASFVFNTSLFTQQTVRRFAIHFEKLVASVIQYFNSPISDLEMMPFHEFNHITKTWAKSDSISRSKKLITQLIDDACNQYPDNIAVTSSKFSLNYKELQQKSEQVCSYLIAKHGSAGPTVVAVLARRSPEMICAMLGVLKAGMIYLPLDPEYPADRLLFMIQDSGAKIVLRGYEFDDLELSDHIDIYNIDEITYKTNGRRVESAIINPNSPAYIIYTSGSSGTPKGVVVTHQAIADHILFMANHYEYTSKDRALQFAALNFDASLEQIFAPLISGAAVVLRDEELWAPAEFSQKIKELNLTVINPTTSYWNHWVDFIAQSSEYLELPLLRLVIAGGDAMKTIKVEQWKKTAYKDVTLLNAYGPTEAVITATTYSVPIEDLSHSQSAMPIGQPCANRKIYVLDRYLRPVPVGTPGELYIGGSTIASGYIGLEKTTNESFLKNPFDEGIIYKTGDKVKWLENGYLLFIGRIDEQAKIRGRRIEPREIEVALLEHPKISEGVVTTFQDSFDEKQLAAYFTTEKNAVVESLELANFLRAKLPDYMVPAWLQQLEYLPTLPGGKIDKKSLPDPDSAKFVDNDSYVSPRSKTEEELSNIVCNVLKIERVGVYDNFFEMGGHSILGTQIIFGIREKFGVDLPLKTIFEDPTIDGFSKAIAEQEAAQYASDELEGILRELDNLSDDEAAQLLGS